MKNTFTTILVTIAACAMSCVQSFGQTVTIGFGTEKNYYFPYGNYYKYAVTQSIYTASEIGSAGQIASIAYNVAAASSYADQDVKIYMGHTALSTFASTASALNENDLTLVYEGTLTLGASTGWEKVYLNNVFDYNGTDNLVIVVARKTPSTYNTTLKYYYSSGSTLYCASDSEEANGSVSHTMTYMDSNRPNVQIGFTPALVDGYYQIGDANDLLWFANYVNSGHATINGKLTADIDLTDVEWTPIDYEGTFDGNGDTIRNLTNNIGLFRTLDGGTIKNVSLVNSSITGTGFIGGIVGDMMSGTISKCCYKGTVSGVIAVGGIVGRCWSGRIENCYSMADVTATISNAGGICGYNADATITNTYVGKNKTITAGTENAGGICGYNEGTLTSCHTIDISSVSSPKYCGGLVGQDNGGTYSNCTYYQYAAMDGNSTRQNGLGNETAGSTTSNPSGVSSKDYDFTSAVGSGNYCYLLNGSQNAGTVWKQTIGDDKYPVLDTTHLPVYKIGGRAYANKEITFSGGSGDPWTPFQISTAEELKNFAYLVNLGNSSLSGALTADIVLNENVLDENGNLRSDYKTANLEQWTPMSSFSGSFLGSNHTISGLYINSSLEKVGLFKEIISSGRVSYLGIVDSYISGSSYVGALAGKTSGATITSCYNTGVVEGSSFYVGGLIGMAGGTITNCYNTGNVSSKGERVGGIAGCFGYYSGSATVTGCYNTGNVTSTSSTGQVGGLAGALVNSSISFSKCYNTGDIIGKTDVGGCFGLVSSSSQSATNCYNTGSVVATGGDAGGVVASNAGKVSYCFNGGSVAGTENVGGVAATNTGTISYCYYNSDFCSHGGINSEDVANSAQALTSTNFTSSTLPTNFDSEVWTAGNTQGASASIISEDGILGYRIVGKYPSITGVGTAQEIIVKYVNVGTEKQPNWISNFIPIYTITDFKNIRNNLSATYVLMNDIVETENFSSLNVFTPTVTWPQIGEFTGKIYGNNHTVSGVYINNAGRGTVGLIATANGALIRDLGLIESKIQGVDHGAFAGGICGYAENTTFLNCYNSAEVIGMVAGGITSKGYHTTITQCKNYGTITSMASEHADGIIGGIIGELYFTTVQQCYNEGTITSDLKAGGIAGEGGYDKIYNSYNAGAVSGQMAGGILGTKGTVGGHSNCLNIGNVSGTVNAGGILGSGSASSGAIYNCYYDINTSNIEGGIDGSDAQNMAEGIETDELCLEIQAGFSSDIWGVKAPIVEGNKKYLYYPYLKCFGEESAKLATYRPISRVVLNQNGGTCTPLTQYIEREGATLPQDVVRNGYTFGGWYTNASCTSDEFAEIPVTATGEQTFYAKWTANDYEVSLCANGGSINSGNVTSYTCGTYTTLPNDVTRTGYTFKGWYPALTCNVCDLVLDSVPPSSRGFAIILLYHEHEFSELGISNQEAVEMVYNAPSVIASQISIDDAMYYKQKLEEYDAVVSLESFGLQEGAELCDLILESYGSNKLNVIKIVKNYTGLGLKEAKNLVDSVDSAPVTILTQVPFATAQAMKDELDGLGSDVVSSFANNTGGQPISIIYPTDLGDKQFGAKWEANKYAVNLQENGGTNTKNIDEYTYGISVTLPDETEITREGYSFAGWYMNSSFNGTAVKKISTSDYGDKTFYAKWVPKEYAITFDVNGGVFNSNYPESYIYGTTTLLPSSVSRPGYSFNGWIEKPWYSVRLDSYGDSKANVIKALSEVTKYSLSESSDIVNKVPVELTYSYLEDKANEIKDTLESYGATVTIQNKRELSIKYEIYLNSYGDSKAAVAKAVKNILNIGISEALKLVLQAPVKLAIVDTETEANEIRDTLENYGASVSFFSTLDYPVNIITSLDCGDRYYQASWNIIDYDIKYNFNNGTTEEAYVNKYNFGDEITLPIPTREGYEFGGWYNNSNLVGTEFTQIESTETGNKEFWAKWDVNTYTVSLDAKGGDINSGNLSSYTYNVLTILPQDVTKVGHTFEGWFDSENRKVTQISKGTIGDVTFTAHWTAKTYSVTLQTNNGTINAGNVTSYTFGTAVTLPTKEQITKTGYEFLGWYDNSSYDGGEVTEIADNEIGNKNFWARWTAASYEVTLDAAGGTINSNAIERYTYGVGAVLPTDVTKIGFEFKGWKNEENEDALEITTADYGDKTFTAQWEEANYSITYDAKGGSINEEYVSTYNYNVGEITLPTDVTKEGNEFGGWYDNPNFTGERVTVIPKTSYGAKTFYANWVAQKYDVTFVSNGGTINSGAFDKYTYGVVASLPTNVSKEGYTFTGWYADEACEGDVVSIISSTSTGDKTFYAGWSNTAYAVTLYTNDGVVSAGNVMAYTFGTAVALPTKEQISKTGYTFKGWYDNSSCTGTAQTEISAEATGNKSFWAKWTVNTYNVTFVNNGGTINSGNVTGYTFGVGANLPSDVTKTGHKFAGWYDNADFAGDRQTRIDEYATEDQTFYANWTANEYTITYEVAGGSIEDATYKTAYVYGGETALPVTVSKAGHKFAGWFTNSAYEGSAVTGISATEYGNKTFYAKWTVNSYTVTLNANGGTINNGNVTNYTYGVGATLPADVTKTGYAFKGWYDNDEFAGEAITTIANNETGDKTFYAKFTVNTYNVILVTNEGVINSDNVESYEFGKGATLPTDVTKTGYTFDGWYSNTSYIGGSVSSIASNDMGDKQFWAKWTINEYEVIATAENGTVEGTGSYEYKSTAILKAIANDGYEFVGWNDNEVTDARIQFVVTKDTTLVANFKEKEKVQIAGTLEIPTLKTERESAPIDLAGLFTTTEGGEVIYSATSSAPNVVAATVSEGKLFLTVYEYEGEAEITVTATLPNGEKNSVKATASVVLACNIQVAETVTNVSCFGESDGEIALKVTNAAEPYTTLWTGDATEDTLRNVTAGNYTVNIMDNEGCTFSRTYVVSQPAEMTMKATIKNPTCENADGSISIVLTGAENATFAWSNEATSQNIASLAKGDYSVVITNTETGCQISDNFTLVEPEAPVISVATTVETACDKADGAVYITANSDDLIYKWSNSKTTKDLVGVRAGDYTLDVVDSKNCKASLNVTVPSIQLKQPEIALVTVSQESGKNLVVWLKENTDLIDYYTIYRVDTAKNKYDKVVDVPYGELSVYEDLQANPMERAWKYKMSATDVCGNETPMSDYHSSLHLMKIKSLGVENHLAWDPYEGIDFDSYVILRKTKVKGVVAIDTLATIPSDLTSYTDTLPARGTTSYYVGVKLPEVINPKTQFLKAESGPFAIALSNIAELETVDVPVCNVVESNAEVYAIGHTIYVKNAEYAETAVYDVKGGKINFAKDATEYEFNIKLDGVYFVKVGNEMFKIIVK